MNETEEFMEVTLIVFRLLNSLVGVWEIGQSCSRITFRYEEPISVDRDYPDTSPFPDQPATVALRRP